MASRRLLSSTTAAVAPLPGTASAVARLVRGARQCRTFSLAASIPGARRAAAATVSCGRGGSTPAIPSTFLKCAAGSGFARRWESSSGSGQAETKTWSFEQLRDLTANGKPESITIIDVREPHEVSSTGKIPGAINIPVKSSPDSWHISADEFEQRYDFPRPAKDSEVLFYCKAGVRSRAAAGLATDAGWKKVGEYPGSWDDWAANGGKIER